MTARSFHLGDDNLFTHQLPRAIDEVKPEILRQHPDLADVQVPPKFYGEEHVKGWLAEQVGRFGESRELTPMPADAHTVINPLLELMMMRPTTPVITVVIPEEGAS